MRTTPARRVFASYVTALLVGAVVHMVLPAAVRPLWFFVISLAILPPVVLLVRRSPRGYAVPWILLSVAFVFLSAGNGVRVVIGTDHRMAAEFLVTIGHTGLLAAALGLVIQRGRLDSGGLIDAAVVAMSFGGLLWTCVLQPRVVALGLAGGVRAALLITVFVLTGVLGALGRLWATSDEPLLALRLLVYALVFALAGNTTLAMTTGSMTDGRLAWVEALFLLSYACVGAAVLHPSAVRLTQPGPEPVDRLNVTRLVFLGFSVALGPAVGGGRQLLGLPVDGMLIVASTVAVVPLVMIRIGVMALERERAQRALAHQATHDALTGLPNRAEAIRRLTAALEREDERDRGETGSGGVVLLFCDLNGFKAINDRLGHVAGDLLLTQIARRLSAGLRAGDTLARYGGDEFLVLCESADAEDARARLCAYLDTALAVQFDLGEERVVVGASVGAVLSDRTAGALELVRRADQAMYAAKQRSRRIDRVEVALA